ncbi:MAG TPA: Gfo/Idh/MocA family oxidoreductase [Polyangiaceae bacterium]|nr:Gfo/Idh/MocA family oxidoreductase [Polyangiaceae bacterium]
MSGDQRGEPLRIGAVGLGQWGRRLAARMGDLPELELLAICDAEPSQLEASSWGQGVVAATFDQLLEDPGIEAIGLALPPPLHGEFGARVLESGKHLFVEKPMATSAEQAERLVRLAEARGLQVCVGHVTRHHPATRECERLVRSGELGALKQIFVDRVGARPRPGVTPWWVLAPHDLSLISALGPGPIVVRGASHEPSGETRAHLSLGGESEAFVYVAPTGAARRLTVWCCERGVLWLDEASSTVFRSAAAPPAAVSMAVASDFDGTHPTAAELVGALSRLPNETRIVTGDALANELRAFQRAVRHGEPLSTDVRDGARVVGLLEAVDRFVGARADGAR